MIGLFVIIGILIGVAAVVWLGASDYFAGGDRYVTYFDESVQGLSADSTVKYRGVTVGRVESIGIAPDNRLIEVVMKINIDEELQRATVAQLKPLGITGMVFVELNRRSKDDPETIQEHSFLPEYPLIPSRPSGISEIFTRINTIADQIGEIDLKELSRDLHSAVRAADVILNNPKITDLILSLDGSMRRLERTLGGLDRIMAEGEPERIVAELTGLLADTRRVVDLVERAVTEADIPGATGHARDRMDALEEQTGELMEELERTVRFTALEIRDISSRLRGTTQAIDDIVRRLSLNPSDILFSRPPEPAGGGER
jgi:phospholipid/cholesterol/gamma-HCH transport system substrate-binding protein